MTRTTSTTTDLVQRLKSDNAHVQYAMDLWGRPMTAAGAQSIDGKATYVLLRLAGNVGQIQANESVDAVRDIVNKDPPPQGLKVYVSGSAPMASDTLSIANKSLNNITIVTIILILVMLLLVYRSLTKVAVPMYSVLFEILIAKGVVSTLGHYGFIPMSSFAVNIVVSLTLGAGTDYGIFLMGRYQEARQTGKAGKRPITPLIKGVADHHRLRADDRRRVLLPELRAPGLLPHHGPRSGDQHAVHHRGGADPGAGFADAGQPVRALRPRTQVKADACTGGSGRAWCAGRCRSSRPVPRSSCSGRSSCRLTAELRRPGVPTRRAPRPKRGSRPRTGTFRPASCSPRC